MQPDRHIPLQGASNFRDFGGYPAGDGRGVKWRRLYRSDKLSELTAEDYATLAEHAIRRVYDLRRDSEVAAWPTRWPGDDAPDLIHSPLFNDEAGLNTFERIAANDQARHDPEASRAIMSGMYVRMVTDPGPLAAFKALFTQLAEPGAFPALFHCAGGKDRTGVTCALILSVLGVARADIVEDFMLTRLYYASDANREKRIAQIVAGAELGFWSEEALKPIFGVEEAYIETALDLVEAAGGVEPFLVQKVGVAPEALERIRNELLV